MAEEPRKENPEQFSFLREKIKERPLSRKKLLGTAGAVAASAVLFGVIAAFVFVYVEPFAREKLYPQEPDPVTFPDDEEVPLQPETPKEPQDPVIIQEKVALELEDYEALFGKMSALAAECSRSLVTVTSATNETDWFNELLENKTHGTGAIIADNSLEYLILTERRLVSGADHISVTFADGISAEAAVKSYDGNTGLAVLSVPCSALEEETRNAISIASLGNSYLVRSGSPVIAAGSPMEYENAVMFGNITSQSNYVKTNDANYRILTTDIPGSMDGTGVLLNMRGEVVGIIAQNYRAEETDAAVVAFAVSDLKSVIEKLSNGGQMGYMGIRGTDVTASVSEMTGMPKGVYVEVTMDSPAMQSGIQNGDIITAVNNEPVENMKAIQNIMMEFEPEQALNLTIMRQGKDEFVEMKYVVTLGRLE